MKSLLGITIAFIYLIGSANDSFLPPRKGKCPFKDGIMKKLTEHHGVFVGSAESTVDIWGKDSVVLSATDGRVTDVIYIQGIKYVSIRGDTTIYTYADIDRALVQEGQLIKSGQPIGVAREGRIEFFVANYLGRQFRNPDAYVDCVCELPKATPQ
jgi:Peptidase family M23